MRRQDFDRFTVLMIGVAENYGQSLTPQGIALRFRMLEPYPVEDVESAAFSIISNRKYTGMPTVADFLEYLGGGSVEDQAEVEAANVLEAIRRHGSYASVVFDNPTTMAVIERSHGGWVGLCEESREEGAKWFRINFAKTWAAYRRQGVTAYGVLAGRHEISNTANGFLEYIPPPVRIGDPEKADRVLAAGRASRQDRLAIGQERLVSGQDRLAIGQDRLASGQDRLAIGQDRLASGQDSLAFGQDRLASGQDPLAIGRNRLASGHSGSRLAPASGVPLRALTPARLAAAQSPGQSPGLSCEALPPEAPVPVSRATPHEVRGKRAEGDSEEGRAGKERRGPEGGVCRDPEGGERSDPEGAERRGLEGRDRRGPERRDRRDLEGRDRRGSAPETGRSKRREAAIAPDAECRSGRGELCGVGPAPAERRGFARGAGPFLRREPAIEEGRVPVHNSGRGEAAHGASHGGGDTGMESEGSVFGVVFSGKEAMYPGGIRQ